MRVVSKYLILHLVMMGLAFSSSAQTVGNCTLGRAMADLDVNNVQARAYNNGGLFWKGSGNVYMVPNGGEASSIFAAGIWIGGLDDEGDLRFAGTAYGPFEFWPGPIDEFGNPPADCERYDHIYSVYRSDLEALDRGEPATADIINWPYNLGAPVEDGDGILGNYNLDGGDRPEITGDQMLWWTMNDAGNFKEWSRGRPIGLEVQVSAYAFLDSTAIDNTTFYRYRFRNKGASRLSKSYFGFWVDADLGNAADDFIGSDTTLGLAITYNGRDVDLGDDGYGERPPAVGIDFVQGPIAPDLLSRTWVDPDGTSHPGMWRRQMTTFLYYNGDSSVQGNPTGGTLDPYRYLQGIWRDGTHMTYGGTGYGGRSRTDFMFSGNAAKREYWSEENTDGLGSRNTPADRKFLMSTGPFDLLPGDEQEIVLAIVWSQADSRFGSYAKLLDDDAFVQSMFDRNFEKMPLIEAPLADATTNNESIILSWQNPPSSNNYLERYDERSDAVYDKYKTDLTYSFEGYNVIQYESATDSVGKIIATYDLVNRVQGIAEEQYDDVNDLYVNVVVAQGKDLGVQHYHVVEDVVNYDTYYFGVQAYAYNENSRPKVITSDVSRIEVLPAPAESARGGTSTTAQAGDIIASDRLVGTGSPKGIFATVVAPAAITGNQYRVSILALPDTSALTFQIEDANSDSLLIDGVSVYETSGDIVGFNNRVLFIDGIEFSVNTAPKDFAAFLVTANANGPIVPPTGGAADFQGFPVPNRPGSEQQQGPGIWMTATGDVGTGADYNYAFIPRSVRNGFDSVVPFDFEVRFTPTCYNAWRTAMDANDPFATPPDGCYGYDRFAIFGDARPQLVPFELWNTGVQTLDDPSDDFRMIPAVIDWEEDGWDLQFFDSSVSGSDNDPETDWFYWLIPCAAECGPDDVTPGAAGYERWKASILSGSITDLHGSEVLARMVFVNWNGGAISNATDKADYLANVVNQIMPEPGTVFRFETTKPLAAGDVFMIDTQPFAPETNQHDLLVAGLDKIGIVPNPYKGASSYEAEASNRVVRFTSMPDVATIRVFTIAGTLVREIQKNSTQPYLEWDLKTDEGFRLGSGIYLIHISVPGVGERVIKFGHIGRS